ncbi:RuvX/YqgF family protein [Helicobacter sp. T3_23-1059]
MQNLSQNHNQSPIIACDIGLKRIGLATIIEGIILPLEPIFRKNRNQAAQDLRKILQKRGAKRLIVGLPEDIQDKQNASPNDTTLSQNPTSTRIKHFISLLDCASLSCEVVFVDESFSSQFALENLSHATKSTRKKASKDGRLDSLAACEILRRYIASLAT